MTIREIHSYWMSHKSEYTSTPAISLLLELIGANHNFNDNGDDIIIAIELENMLHA